MNFFLLLSLKINPEKLITNKERILQMKVNVPTNNLYEDFFDLSTSAVEAVGYTPLKVVIAEVTTTHLNRNKNEILFHYLCEKCGRYVKEYTKGNKNPLKCCGGKNMKEINIGYGEFTLPPSVHGNNYKKGFVPKIFYEEKIGGTKWGCGTNLGENGIEALQRIIKRMYPEKYKNRTIYLKEIEMKSHKYGVRVTFTRGTTGKEKNGKKIGKVITELKLTKINGSSLEKWPADLYMKYGGDFGNSNCQLGEAATVLKPICIIPV